MLHYPILISAILALDASAISHLAVSKSDGCKHALPESVQLGHSTNLTMASKSGESTRKYRIHIPEDYEKDTPVPLILSFHGRTKDMLYQEQLSQFSNTSFGFKGISVYPEGVPAESGSKQWQGDPDSHGIDDILFTNELLDELLNNYCIDPKRIYAAGKSNGGGFTGLLACDTKASERIAAFAPVSGAFYLEEGNKPPSCEPTKARKNIPILDYHGLLDQTILYDGGPNKRGGANTSNIVEWVNDWAERNGFDTNANSSTTLCSKDKLVTKYSWNDTVVHYKVGNLEHVWPSEFGNVDTKKTTCKDADATRMILDWFAKWSL